MTVGFFIFLVGIFTSIYKRDSNGKTYLLKKLYYANFFIDFFGENPYSSWSFSKILFCNFFVLYTLMYIGFYYILNN